MFEFSKINKKHEKELNILQNAHMRDMNKIHKQLLHIARELNKNSISSLAETQEVFFFKLPNFT